MMGSTKMARMGAREAMAALLDAGSSKDAVGYRYDCRADELVRPDGKRVKVGSGSDTYQALRVQGYDDQGMRVALSRVLGL